MLTVSHVQYTLSNREAQATIFECRFLWVFSTMQLLHGPGRLPHQGDDAPVRLRGVFGVATVIHYIPDKESTIPETSELRILRITTMPVRCSNALRELHCDEGI